ncbi:endonuclease/exonuclease/phosphatase family protein [Nocardioides sp. URHA0020]|uniref:endonuclease/exonuclease/phosphatase family protein n=1 Tax=Nocardioides sp. URHA0020 TaxID=1380392 RepID=UPI000AA318F1|nr:endonuclease/exonuclease/phosphatase family protein [Nocardioides sp. URHA0020]
MRARVVVFWSVVAVCLVPALLLTFTRLVEPRGGFWIKVEAFTPLGLALYAVALVLVAARILLRRRWRTAALPVALLAVAGLVLHAWWFAPQLTGASPPPEDGAAEIVVMSANLLVGSADGIEVVREASEAHVDLLVVQEVTLAVLADMDRAGLGDLLPYRAGAPGVGASGTMAFSRVQLSDATSLPTYFGGWTFSMGDLRVAAVHPRPPTDADGWYDDQAVVARTVAELEPDLVVGDFNATVDHAPMRALADAGYRDAGELANQGWQPTWPTRGVFDVAGMPLAQIDHVLVGDRLAALDQGTVAVPGSDHRGVVATVAMK